MMPRRVLVIPQSERQPDVGAARTFAQAGVFTARLCRPGSLLDPGGLSKSETIVGIALSDPSQAIPFLQTLRARAQENIMIAVLPASAGVETLEAAAKVVDDFVLWPLRDSELEQRMRWLLARKGHAPAAVSERLIDEFGLRLLVGKHPAFLRVLERMPIIARSGGPALITGETGTGKELSARAIHHLSRRRDFPFIAVDCAALPEHLVENELFGHTRGAFTDAHRDQKGLIALAEKGTLFLDEVDALPLSTQVKLLRFLQERTYKPLGSERFLRADLNVLAASNHNLEALVARKQLRPDLFYRLNVFRLALPALRDRRSDIAILALHFLEGVAARESRAAKTFSVEAMARLEAYPWPGNVRELFNVVHQAEAFSAGQEIQAEDVLLPGQEAGTQSAPSSFKAGRARAVESFEVSFIQELLRKHCGNVTRAALEAKKDRRTFGRLMKKYNIARNPV